MNNKEQAVSKECSSSQYGEQNTRQRAQLLATIDPTGATILPDVVLSLGGQEFLGYKQQSSELLTVHGLYPLQHITAPREWWLDQGFTIHNA